MACAAMLHDAIALPWVAIELPIGAQAKEGRRLRCAPPFLPVLTSTVVADELLVGAAVATEPPWARRCGTGCVTTTSPSLTHEQALT
jgi:hypothetical protein